MQVAEQPIQITLNYKKAKRINATATPTFRDITLRDIKVQATGSSILCDGLDDSVIRNLTVTDVTITGNTSAESCDYCQGTQSGVSPKLCIHPELDIEAV